MSRLVRRERVTASIPCSWSAGRTTPENSLNRTPKYWVFAICGMWLLSGRTCSQRRRDPARQAGSLVDSSFTAGGAPAGGRETATGVAAGPGAGVQPVAESLRTASFKFVETVRSGAAPQTGHGTATSRVRAVTTTMRPSSDTSSMTNAARPENTVPTKRINRHHKIMIANSYSPSPPTTSRRRRECRCVDPPRSAWHQHGPARGLPRPASQTRSYTVICEEPITVARRRAGSTPAVLRISHNVNASIPHAGFSVARHRTRR